MAKRIEAVANKDTGKTEVTISEAVPTQQELEDEARVSAAKKRWERLKAQREPLYVPFECEGETVFIKQLNAVEVTELALSISRNEDNVLEISAESGVSAAQITILRHAVYANADGEKYFAANSEVSDFIHCPQLAGFILSVFEECVTVNPDIFGTVKKN